MKNNIRKGICFVICMGMLIAVLGSCAEKEPVKTDAAGNILEETESTTVTAYQVLEDLSATTRIKITDLHEVKVSSADLPAGTITDAKNIVGKYLTVDVVAGEYIMEGKLSDQNIGELNKANADYIVVTDYMSAGGEISSRLQKLINENPNKTLYFPDGVYQFAKPVTTSADPAKAVSFELSKFAIFQPAVNYKPDGEHQGLIRIGATDSNMSGSCTFSGGVISMGGKDGAAISVEGGKDVLINNFALRDVSIGIYLGTNYADIDNGSISGLSTDNYGAKTVTGIYVDSSYNTLSNLRIYLVTIGIKLLQGDNVMRNLHPLYGATNNPEATAFWDESSGNRYDYCYSDNFAIGFHLSENTVSQLNCCFALWWNQVPNRHWGIRQMGQFNSLVTATRIDMSHYDATNVDNAFIWIENPNGGKGMIIDANTNESRIESKYQTMYTNYKKTP